MSWMVRAQPHDMGENKEQRAKPTSPARHCTVGRITSNSIYWCGRVISGKEEGVKVEFYTSLVWTRLLYCCENSFMAGRIINKVRIALIQLAVTANKENNLKHAMTMISQAASKSRANSSEEITPLIVLPECFNSPYGTQYFADYAEEIPGKTTQMLSQVAKDENIYLIGGSIPERKGDKLYNTSTVYNPKGEMIVKFSKCHLFDIDIPGKIRFQESDVLSPGKELGVFEILPGLKVGLGICYDLRFPELSLLLRQQGCNLLVFPGAFNMTTGPAHWELLQRARAVDNQVYVAACSPARNMEATYHSWAHSSAIDPWGEVIAKAADTEEIIYADIDLDRVDIVRQQIPVHTQKRHDIYQLRKVD